MTRGGVWIGDWLRAWTGRGSVSVGDRDAAEFLREALQIERIDPGHDTPLERDRVQSTSTSGIQEAVGVAAGTSTATGISSIETSAKLGTRPSDREVRIEILPPRQAPPHVRPLAVPNPLPRPAERLPERDVAPLFKRSTERALIGALVAAWRPEGAIAIRTLVDNLARCVPPTRVPRRLVPTTRLGAILLIEREAAEPLAADVIALRRQLERVVALSIPEWWIAPRGRPEPRGPNARAWPPPVGTPVLAIVTSPATVERIEPELVERRCPIINIVPGRDVVARPSAITVGWDPRTTVAAVSRARRRADRR